MSRFTMVFFTSKVEWGPTAPELAIMTSSDCAVTIFADVCKQGKIELSKVEVVAEAEKLADLPILSRVTIKTSFR